MIRCVRALIDFQKSPIRQQLLQPNPLDPIFRINRDLINKCGEKKFRFKHVRKYFNLFVIFYFNN